jgi:hypothetical protein
LSDLEDCFVRCAGAARHDHRHHAARKFSVRACGSLPKKIHRCVNLTALVQNGCQVMLGFVVAYGLVSHLTLCGSEFWQRMVSVTPDEMSAQAFSRPERKAASSLRAATVLQVERPW